MERAGASDMDGCAAKAAARESGDERVQSLTITEISRDVPTPVDMTADTDSPTKIALVQMQCGVDPEKNFSRAIELIREAAKKGGQIVCLPELFRSQYFCQTEEHKNFELAEEIPGNSTEKLGEVARELGVVIIASLFEKRRAGLYHNTAAIIDADGKLSGKYRKMHIPD